MKKRPREEASVRRQAEADYDQSLYRGLLGEEQVRQLKPISD